ncbi:MAG: hypothetical protein OQJ80_11640, partial [Kangiella sp.]|nr:hypothetical protein [Kangiella sp.]
HPAFDQYQVVSELLSVIKANKLNVNEDELLKYSNKITACVILLLHETTFEYGAHKQGFCRVSCENSSIPYQQIFVDQDGNPVEHKESFGNLQVIGHVILEKDGKDLTICYPLMTTNLSVEKWCHDDMFVIEPLTEDHPNYLHKKMSFDKPLCLTDSGRIGVLHT